MRKVFAVNEVIRYTIYIFVITRISVIHSQFDITPLVSSISADDQIKDPYESTADYLDRDLNSTLNDLQSIYEQTQNLLYNASLEDPILQIYPSMEQQNFSDWFTQLLNNSKTGNSAKSFNFSKSPQVNFTKDSFQKLPSNFKVFPSSGNITALNTILPSNPRSVDANNIFRDASGSTSYLNDTNDIYTTAPRIDSLSLNTVKNRTDILNKFFQGFKNTKSPFNLNTNIPSAVMGKPVSSIPNIDSLTTDILAKQLAQNGNKNSSKFLQNMFSHLGLQNVNTVGSANPMNLYRLNGDGEHQEFNRSSVEKPTLSPPNFRPPTSDTSSNQTNKWIFPLPNHTPTVTPNPPIAKPPPLVNNVTNNQADITVPSVANSTVNLNSSITNSSTPQVNPSFSAMATDSLSDEYGKIVYSLVFFTQGSHNPPLPYPTDPFNDTKYWREGINQLTNAGKSEMYQLGKWFHQRYRELVGWHYNASLVTVESGGSDLTLMSAEVMTAGLFPPKGNDVWNPAIGWQPTPVYSMPTESDNVILMSKPCRQYGFQIKDLNASPEWQQFYDNNTDTFNYLSENVGYNFTKDDILDDLKKIFYIYEDLQIEEKVASLPNWTEKVYPDQLRSLAEKYIEFAVETRQLQKIKTGPFFQKLTDYMSKKINGSNSTSQFLETLHFYSGSTFALGFIMETLGVFNSSIPPNGAALLFDLRYKDNDYIITVSYKNSSVGAPHLLTIPNCQPICRFEDFIGITKDLMSKDWDDDCATITLSDLTYTIPILIFGVVIVFILALVIVLLCIKCCKYIRGSKATFS